MEQQEVRVGERLNGLMGKVMECVVEGYDRYSEMYFGRNITQAPEIDGMTYFKSKKRLYIGNFVNVKLTDVIDNNLIGEVVE